MHEYQRHRVFARGVFNTGDYAGYNPGNNTSPGDYYMDSTGKKGDTTYNVCVYQGVGTTWYGPARGSVKTLSPPASGYFMPPHAKTIDTTNYPAEIAADMAAGTTTNTDIYTVPSSSGCSTLSACLTQAVGNVKTRNAIIIPTRRVV